MILTCPSCTTRYVVKDGAIPSAGRTVRCAQCKHSWHQDPEPGGEGADLAQDLREQNGSEIGQEPAGHPLGEASGSPRAGELGDHAHPDAPASAEGFGEDPDAKPLATPSSFGGLAASGLDSTETEATMPREAAEAEQPYPEEVVPVEEVHAPGDGSGQGADVGEERPSHPIRASRIETDDLYSPFADHDLDDDRPRRRWPLALVALLLIAVIAAGVYFLAPAELKGRLGIAQADASSRLTVQVQQHGRTQLASGNQLFEVSGIVRNETEQTVTVPPLNAQLRSVEQEVVYRWTIPISPPLLAPGATASFNSANLDVPSAAACLEVFFGRQRSAPRCQGQLAVGA